jgi:hypothetical protein
LQAAGSLALLCAEGGTSGCNGVQANMLATGAFSTVDVYDVTSSLPAIGAISGYNAVLAWTDYTPSNPVGLGNLLVSYVNLGGRHLTMATYAFSTPWEIDGGITGGFYAALTNLGVNGTVGTTLVATVPGDAIFTGITLSAVTYFVNINYAHPGLAPDLAPAATVLATDANGIYLIARSPNGVINMNIWPAGHGANSAFFTLLANTLTLGPTANAVPLLAAPTTGLLMLTGIVGLTLFQARERLAQLLRG